MKAIHEAFISKNRQVLGNIVPLDKPMSLVVEPSSYCNLRCSFCTFSNPEALLLRKHIAKNMSVEMFCEILRQADEFAELPSFQNAKFVRLYFVGLGEVLCNPDLSKMIEIAKKSGLFKKVEMVTNGVGLTEKVSTDIVDAGLDTVVISVNGLDAADYLEVCKTKINYEEYYEQIKFLYNNRKQLRIDLKTTDAVANTPEREKLFFEMYGDLCDRINIETVAPFHEGAVLSGVSGSLNRHNNFFDRDAAKVCSWAFYKLCVLSDGRINFCDPIMGPVEGLNIENQTLKEMWDSDIHKDILLKLLSKDESQFPEMCRGCNTKYCTLGMKEEVLDPYADVVKARILGENT
jgi:MoaA/NifB/PqqE/SkfB family radical SAM enzyme